MRITKDDFLRDVIAAFSPVVDFGFRCTKASEETIVLETDSVLMYVRYDHKRSFEVGVEVSLKGNHPDLEVYILRDIFRETGVPDADNHSFCQTQNYSQAMAFLTEVAVLLRRHAELVLQGDLTMFRRLEERQSREAAAYTRQVQLRGVHEEANQAWKDRRFQKYVDLLKRFEDVLSESERKKLEYASEKIQAD